jgi:hypothetical protein
MRRMFFMRSVRNVLSPALLMACMPPNVLAIVTADAPGTHVAVPGVPALGLAHEGVGKMDIFFPGIPTPGICTCSALAIGGGRFAITAAHCVSDGSTVVPTSITITWMTPGGPVTRTSTAAMGQIYFHPSYDGDVFHGFDVAILEFDPPLPPSVPLYELYDPMFDGPLAFPTPLIRAGFGATGFGTTGDALPSGTKRVGANTFESFALSTLGVATPTGWAGPMTQLTFDFDEPAGISFNAFAFFFGMASPSTGGDEVMGGLGDSGGPSFISPRGGGGAGGLRIAGVGSYRTRVRPAPVTGTLTAELTGIAFPGTPDIDTIINSTFGEFEVDAYVGAAPVKSWIATVIPPVVPCPADFNGVDGITVQDIFDFLADWASQVGGGPVLIGSADFNSMDGITVQDIVDFLAAWTAGCP